MSGQNWFQLFNAAVERICCSRELRRVKAKEEAARKAARELFEVKVWLEVNAAAQRFFRLKVFGSRHINV